MIARIVEEGYPIEEMGIDRTRPKWRAILRHFLHQPRLSLLLALFQQYGTETRDIARYGIDPSSYERQRQSHLSLKKWNHRSPPMVPKR